MARDRSIALRVRAEVADAVRGLEQVGRAAGDVGDRSDDAGRKSQTLGQRVAQSARDQRQDWQTVGSALTAYGAAITGVGGLVLATGINYNSLRQTATQALTAVTGSTEEAGEQMRRLDQYGQNSWLMRDTLITAQQQMTGFGIETGKVIPYMDALAEATAATGGTNQDFLEMAEIMGQIQSQGRITAEELRRFGVRGVDAASLIGEAMGMTAGEIREQITAGTLDAEVALDALAAGMVDRYGGASDLVRQTWRGAVDDVMAAFRDISAVIASPLVDPEGGGLLVDFLNRLSDALFTLRDMPPIVLQVGGALAGLTGVATLGAGGLMLAIPRYLAFRDSLSALSAIAPTAARHLGTFVGSVGRLAGAGAIIAGVTLALGALAEVFHNPAVFRDMDEMQQGIREIAAAGTELQNVDLSRFVEEQATFFGATTIEAENLGDVFDRLLNPSVTDRISDFFGAVMPSYMHDNRAIAQELDEALTEMLNAGGADEVAAIQFLNDMGLSADELAEILPNASTAMEILGDSSLDAADGLSEAEAAAQAAREEAEALREAWIELARQAGESFGSIADTFNAAQAASEEFGLSTTQTMDAWISEMQAQAEAAANWGENWIRASEQVRDELPANMHQAADAFVDEMAHAGEEGAAMLQLFVDGTPAQRQALIEAWLGTGSQMGEEFANEVEATRAPDVEINDEPARSGFETMVDDFGSTTTDTNLDADTTPAERASQLMMGDWEGTTTDTMLSADPGPAIKVFNAETGAWERTTTDTLLDLDDNQAVMVFNRTTGQWERTTTRTLLDANDGPARGTVRGLGAWANRQTYSVNVTANIAAAQARIRQLNNQRVQVGADLMRASGGPVFGPGSETSDSIAARLSHNEHVLSAREVRGLGGHGAVEQMRAMARAGVRGFAQGGTPAYRYAPSFTAPAPSVTVQAPRTTGPIRLHPSDIDAIGQVILSGAHRVGQHQAQAALVGASRRSR